MEITLTNSNSLKIISGNCTLITNPDSADEYNIGLFNDPMVSIKNNKLNVNSPGEFEIDNFYITSIGYKLNKTNGISENKNNEETNEKPVQKSLIDFETEQNQINIVDNDDDKSGEYGIYYLIQVEGIKILSLGNKTIPANHKNKLSSENPKIILTPHINISTKDGNTFQKLTTDIDYRVIVISDLQESYNEEQVYENSRIAFGVKDKSNLNKLNVTVNNIPKDKRIVLLNKSK
jgi:hypothetical protein